MSETIEKLIVKLEQQIKEEQSWIDWYREQVKNRIAAIAQIELELEALRGIE